jgi:adenylate cyclase
MLTRFWKALPLGVLIAICGIAISFLPFAHDFEEDVGLGLLFKLRGAKPAPADAVVVSIDKDSADQLGVPENPDKWPRSLHARLVDVLSKAGAAVVTFDVHFLESRVPADDELFARAMARARNVVLGNPMVAREISASGGSNAAEHGIVRIVKPLPILAESAVATAPFVLPRIPFKVNQYWTFQTEGALSPPPTLPVVAYQLFRIRIYDDFVRLLAKVRPALSGKLPSSLDASIETKSVATLVRSIKDIFDDDPTLAGQMMDELRRSDPQPVDADRKSMLATLIKLYGGPNRRYVNYYGPPQTVTTIPYHRVLQLGESNESGKLDLAGKAVFVGLSEKLLAERKDSFYTVFSQANGVFIAGVEIAATAFLNLLEDRPVNPIGDHVYLVLILVWGLLLGVSCRLSSILVAASTVTAASATYLFWARHSFAADGTWYPLVVPLFAQAPLAFAGAAAWSYVETSRERRHLRRALAYYVPDEICDQLARNIVDLKQSGEVVYGACLFGDIAGYTTLSEKMSPQQLSDRMHEYFSKTFEPVKKYGGMVVSLKGDSFLAIWKAARAEDRMRRQACLAAIDVAKAVHSFNASVDEFHMPTRLGVHCGQIFLGNIGAGDHYEYGPTGDTVNTASRMDGLNKYLGTELLVSEESVQQLDGLLTREVGRFILKGKVQPMVVHELFGRVDEASEKQREACEIFADAMSAFRRQSWDEAEEKFRRASLLEEADGPTRFYLKLCEEYRSASPGEPWDGAIVLQEK